jgi:energy-coupling factor transporter ATP-binding protein EcfA2
MNVQVYDHPSKKVLITGTSGTGKTTLLEKLLRKEKARYKFVFDHQGEFAHRFKVEPCYGPENLCEAVAAGGWVCFDPVQMYPGKTPEAFSFFCDFAFCMATTQKGRKIFICDELQKLVDNAKTPDELMCILDTGRRYQLDFFGISQAPNLIHNAIRNQLTEVYTFRQSDENAIKFLDANGFNETQVRNLKGHDYLWRNLSTGENNFGVGTALPDDPRDSSPVPPRERPAVETNS